MATITSSLKLDTTFQRFLIDFMSSPAHLAFSADPDGTSATLTSSLFPGQTVHLFGIGLQAGGTGPEGQLTAISIANTAGTAATSITSLPQPFPLLEDLLFAASDGSGPAGPENFFDFYFTLLRNQDNFVTGSKFDDVIEGGEGGSDDTLSGKKGNDTFICGFGNDQINGGKGLDTLDCTEWTFDVNLKVNLKKGTAEINTVVSTLNSIENVDGTGFRDTIRGDKKANMLDGFGGIDKLFGFGGKDVLNGGAGKDRLNGGSGDDILNGGRGNDILDGGSGDDILKGRGGKDTLFGSNGNDTMTGGGGRDTFVFAGFFGSEDDIITDFQANETIRIMDGILSDISVSRVGNDTVITYSDGADTITLLDTDLDKAEINFDLL